MGTVTVPWRVEFLALRGITSGFRNGTFIRFFGPFSGHEHKLEGRPSPPISPRSGTEWEGARFTLQIADPVAVAVLERSHVDLVDDLGLPPVRFERIAQAVADELGTSEPRQQQP